MRSLRVIGAAALLILQVARCNSDISPTLDGLTDVVARDHERAITSSEDIAARDNAPSFGKGVLRDSKRYNLSTISAVALDGRALLAKWLNPVALERRACTGTYKASCGDGYCCPTADRCCTNNGYCKKSSGDDCCTDGTCAYPFICGDTCDCKPAGGVCCPTGGTYCEAGDKCCGDYCTDEANICCSDGTPCEPGNICVANPKYGWQECCTDSACTAYVKNSVTVTRAPTSTTAPLKTTEAPEVVYRYYYTTLYWSYYYYFYTYVYAIEATTITSTYTTTTTVLSVYAANSRSAAARLEDLSTSVEENDFTTPARATTALNSTPARPTASSSSSSDEPIQDDSTDDTNEDDSPTLPVVGGPRLGTGDLPGAGTQAGIVPGWAVAWALGAGVVAWGMVWL
ncbi:hypothetical protein VE03_03031 [Pseudogymnoascus sp. 23342-1-I1]|nr:hypothetical protein VE03_03031 [Pseudogymnoascus sp. 23342-1-I1]